jgi:hypothetical protein
MRLNKHPILDVIVAVIIIILFCYALSHAEEKCTFTIHLENPSNQKVIYALDWIDHPFDSPFIASMAGGELDPDEDYKYEAPCGYWVIVWNTMPPSEKTIYEDFAEIDGGVTRSFTVPSSLFVEDE